MYVTPKIIEVKILEEYNIYLRYENGEEKVYNVEKLILENKFYRNLKDKEKFAKMKLVDITIEWEDGEDIAQEILYHDSISLEEYKKL